MPFDQAAHLLITSAKARAVMQKNRMKMTETRLRLFCIGMATHGNRRKAYYEAGYSPNNARSNAAALLKRAAVQKYIDDLREKIVSDKIATLVEVREFQTSVMRGRVESEQFDENGQVIIAVDRPDSGERLKAASELAKALSTKVEEETKREETDAETGAVKYVVERRIYRVGDNP